MPELITSKENNVIKKLKKLISSKKYRRESGEFVIEGQRSLTEALKENAAVKSVYITREAAEKNPSLAFENAVFITDELADYISDSVSPQGVFAVCDAPHYIPVDKLDDVNRAVVLNGLQDPGNLGTVLRTADAVGVDRVILCGDCCELLNPKVVRSTVGSIFRLKLSAERSFSAVCKALKDSGIALYATVVDPQASDILKACFPKRCAAVIGNEGNGLSEEDVLLCDEKITIHMRGNTESLNASVAAAITLWEMCGKLG